MQAVAINEKKTLLFGLISLWLIYTLCYVTFQSSGSNLAGMLSFASSIISLPIVIAYSLWLSKNSEGKARRIFVFVAWSFIFIFIADFIYKLVFNILQVPLVNVSNLLSSAENITYIGFMVFQLLVLSNIFLSFGSQSKKISKVLLRTPVAVIVVILSMVLFLSFELDTHNFSLNKFYDLVEMVLQLVCFIVAILCVAAAKNKGVFYLSLGYLLGNAANLVMGADWIMQSYHIGSVFETFWFLRYLLIIIGLVYFKDSGLYKEKASEWVFGSNSLRSQTVFWNLMFCMLSIVLTFGIGYLFLTPETVAVLTKNLLKIFVVIFIIYSVLWTVVSNIFYRRSCKKLGEEDASSC